VTRILDVLSEIQTTFLLNPPNRTDSAANCWMNYETPPSDFAPENTLQGSWTKIMTLL